MSKALPAVLVPRLRLGRVKKTIHFGREGTDEDCAQEDGIALDHEAVVALISIMRWGRVRGRVPGSRVETGEDASHVGRLFVRFVGYGKVANVSWFRCRVL